MNDGTIQRYLRITLTIYQEKRDFFCGLLCKELKGAVNFTVPEGGMSVWTMFDASINLENLIKNARQKGLYLGDGKAHIYPDFNANGIRLGFASSTKEELSGSVQILKELIR